jgi:hypothetical protein
MEKKISCACQLGLPHSSGTGCLNPETRIETFARCNNGIFVLNTLPCVGALAQHPARDTAQDKNVSFHFLPFCVTLRHFSETAATAGPTSSLGRMLLQRF